MGKLSFQMVYIGSTPAGLLGMYELFDSLFSAGFTPFDTTTADRLLIGIREHNFVPKPAIDDYRQALRREYLIFYCDKKAGKPVGPKDYGEWEGYPREQIPWFPTVSSALCDGCGNCLEVCPKDVFMLDDEGKVIVADPFTCIVGCCFCKSACDPKAILMPTREMLDQYRHGKRL